MRGKMDCCGLTDVGLRRESNEDQFLIADLTKSLHVHQTSLDFDQNSHLYGGSQGKLLVVADGMGGHVAGERASALALDSLTHYVLNALHWRGESSTASSQFLDDLQGAMRECQRQILSETAEQPEEAGMGTTLTVAFIDWPKLFLVHAGDCRCYLHRSSKLSLLTRDHTIASQLVERGALKAEDEASSPWRDFLWNVLGGNSTEFISDASETELQLGDTLLLCTDGLTKHVSDEELSKLLQSPLTAKETAEQLVQSANAAGGTDNVTVIVARFQDQIPGNVKAEVAAEIAADMETTVENIPVISSKDKHSSQPVANSRPGPITNSRDQSEQDHATPFP